MAQNISWNGSTYTIPDVGNRQWGQNVTNYLVALASGALSKSGGNFTLTADVNFGATYGLVSAYFKSRSSNISASGVLRLANTDKIGFRNNANGADLSLGVSTSDRLQFESANIPTVSSTDVLTNKTIVAASNTITTAASGNLSATELNAALAELQTDVDTRAPSATTVTLTGAQTLTDKTLTSPVLTTPNVDNYLDLNEEADPATPGTDKVRLWAGTDAKLYKLDDAGNKTQLATTAEALTNPMTTEGDIIYGAGSGVATRLAGNTTTTRNFLRQIGNGSASAAPAWDTLQAGDLPSASSSAKGAISYEDAGTFTANFNIGMNVSTNNITVRYSRVGKTVTLTFPAAAVTSNATSSDWATAAGQVPTALRPGSALYGAVSTVNAGARDTNTPGQFFVGADGSIGISRPSNWSSGVANCGFNGWSVSYAIA